MKQGSSFAGRKIVTVFFLACFLLVLRESWRIFHFFSAPFLWAALLSFAFYPAHRRIVSMLSRFPVFATFLSTIILFFIAIFPFLWVITALIQQGFGLFAKANFYINQLTFEQLDSSSPPILRWAQAHIWNVPYFREYAADSVLRAFQYIANFTAAQLAWLAKNTFALSFNFILMIIFAYFFLRDGEWLVGVLYELVPLQAAHRKEFFRILKDLLGRFARIKLPVSALYGIAAGIAGNGVGFVAPFLFGATVSALYLVCAETSALSWVAITIYFVLNWQLKNAAVFLLAGIAAAFCEIKIVSPRSKKFDGSDLPSLLFLLSALGGLAAYGSTGILLGPFFTILVYTLTTISPKPANH